MFQSKCNTNSQYACLRNRALKYLVDCCIPVSDVASRQHLRSASRRYLTVPRYTDEVHSAVGPSLFVARGARTWNSLPDDLRDSSHAMIVLGVSWRQHFLLGISVLSGEMLHESVLYKWRLPCKNSTSRHTWFMLFKAPLESAHQTASCVWK